MDLSIALRGLSHVTTLAVADDLAERADWAASRGSSQVILCLDERDCAVDIQRLVEISPPALLLVSEAVSQLRCELEQANCLVLASLERTTVIVATLIAYADSRAEVQR